MVIANQQFGIFYYNQIFLVFFQTFIIASNNYFINSRSVRPQLEYIDLLDDTALNSGELVLFPGSFRDRNNRDHVDMQFGFIKIVLTNPGDYTGGLKISP